MNRIPCIAIPIFLATTVASYAAPVLLGSFDAFTNGGGAPQSDPRLEFILELAPDSSASEPIGLGTGRDLFVEDRDLRTFYFDASNDPTFEMFALHATDGIEDQYVLWSLFPSGGGDGSRGTESELFGAVPDLVGNDVDFVKLTVFDVRFDPWIPDPETHPDIEGFKFEAFLRYEFYGTPIPEPTALHLIGIAAIVAIGRGRNVRYSKREEQR